MRRSSRVIVTCVLAAVVFITAASQWSVGSGVMVTVLLPLLAVAFAAILRRAGASWGVTAVGFFAVGVYALYLSHTPYDVRNFDAKAHVEYIEYLVAHRSAPADKHCFICHHPPGYHILAALAFRFFQQTGLAEPVRGLHVLSLLLFLVFLGFSALSIERLAPKPYPRGLAMALVALWPYSIINSARVNNDTLVYALCGIVLYLVVRWFQDRRARFLWVAGGIAVLGLFVKASALVLVCVVAGCVMLRVLLGPTRRPLVRSAAPAVAAMLVACVAVGAARPSRGGVLRSVFGSAYDVVIPALAPRTVRSYVAFDLGALTELPFANVFPLQSQEPTYWNHLLKSWGQRHQGLPPTDMARVMNVLLPCLLAVLVIGLLMTKRDIRRRLRAIQLAHWKTKRTTARKLIRLGVKPKL
ncbi:MAG: glycosyltransferase family 39 protein, partial [Polyangiaceae bacterium]|nr:glycosyltransferase family 39 protein [Polyangiaceae bacterium]